MNYTVNSNEWTNDNIRWRRPADESKRMKVSGWRQAGEGKQMKAIGWRLFDQIDGNHGRWILGMLEAVARFDGWNYKPLDVDMIWSTVDKV
jgi:hypothetical protein